MRSSLKTIIITAAAALFFASCGDEYGDRKESTPVIESAAIHPASFTFGDSVTLAALVTDPATTLAALEYKFISDGKIIASGSIPIGDQRFDVAQRIFVPLVSGQADNAQVTVALTARNVLKGYSGKEITAAGKRPVYSRLYLVTSYGAVVTLSPQAAGRDKYEAAGLTLDASFEYRIAEKITSDKQIDYSGAVWGNVNGRLAMIDDRGEPAFAHTPHSDYTQSLVYDNDAFSMTATGGTLGAHDLTLGAFAEEAIAQESFRTLSRTLENNREYTLFGKLANERIVYNLDFFERTASNRVKFLGKTGTYTLYYNPVRQNVILGVENPAYPDYLPACGFGLGYPTRATSQEIEAVYAGHGRTHTGWGFDHILQYVLFRQISDGVYQGTFYTPGDHDHYAGFKPFEDTGWGNEKPAGSFAFTGEQIISGDGDWTIPNGDNDPVMPSDYYRFTVNLNENTVNIEKIIL
ncbi:MAG: hypothetical protein LBL24_07735 [Bacteroidales bacterium]|nr:hypothetical protein [Bacteroidales bacterium]